MPYKDKEKQRQYYLNNKEKIKERGRQYWLNNKENLFKSLIRCLRPMEHWA